MVFLLGSTTFQHEEVNGKKSMFHKAFNGLDAHVFAKNPGKGKRNEFKGVIFKEYGEEK